MEKKIIMLGAGGHALSVVESVPDLSLFEGYTAPCPSERMEIPYLGTDDDISAFPPDRVCLHCGLVYRGAPEMLSRRKFIERFSGYEFATIVAPTAVVTRNSHIGEGSVLLNGCVVNRSSLGRFCVINTGAIVEHDCRLGDNVFLGPGAVLGGFVEIADDCFIGLGARVRNGVKICAGTVVGMGSVVIKDITAPGLYAGVPARRVPGK